MIQIQYGKINGQIPSMWEELTTEQLKIVFLAISSGNNKTAISRCIYYIVPPDLRKCIANFTSEETLALQESLSFLATPPKTSIWALPDYKIGGTLHNGPGNLLSSITIREFGRAELYANKYATSENNDDLLKLACCLYRALRNGKRRQYSDDMLRDTFKKFNELDKNTLEAILLNFACLRESVYKKFDKAFPAVIDQENKKANLNKYGWEGNIQILSKYRHMNPEDYANRPLLEVFIELDQEAIILENQKS